MDVSTCTLEDLAKLSNDIAARRAQLMPPFAKKELEHPLDGEVDINGRCVYSGLIPTFGDGLVVWRRDEKNRNLVSNRGPHINFLHVGNLLQSVAESEFREQLRRGVEFCCSGPVVGYMSELSGTAALDEGPRSRRITSARTNIALHGSIIKLTVSAQTGCVDPKAINYKTTRSDDAVTLTVTCALPIELIPCVFKDARTAFFLQKKLESNSNQEYFAAIRHGPPF